MPRCVSTCWLELLALLLTAAGGCDEAIPTTATCDARVERQKVNLYAHERVDLLFVLDDSPSMAQERRHFLERQLPRAMQLLLHGEVPGTARYLWAQRNFHVGVISSDMGVGAEGLVEGCSASGDAGRLLNADTCRASEPGFVWYYEDKHELEATEAAIACLADVGNAGCQVSQPLEAALEALSPESSPGFLRSSVIIIIILTDQDDCSTHDPTPFASGTGKPQAGASAAKGCIGDPLELRAVQTYVNGLKALRPDSEQLLSVGVIAGVPPEWVSSVLEPARLHSFDSPVLLRDAFDSLLSDPRMQPDASDPGPSCSSATATATAPRRLMQFARDLGQSAYVRSICDYDLADMFFEMLDVGGHPLGGSANLCTRLPARPDARGLVPCRITWELPELEDPEEPLTPASCADRPDFLSEPSPGFAARSERGRALCEMRQAPVVLASDGSPQPQGEGFFHVAGVPCSRFMRGERIQFTEHAKPPVGVTLTMECLDPMQREPGRPDCE